MDSKRILLCSPKGVPGGISQWTENILSHSNTDNSVVVSWFYPEVKNNTLTSNLSKTRRFMRGVRYYVPFIRHLKKHIDSNHYDVVHFSTSGKFSFLRDYFALKVCKNKGLNTVLHLHFGRIPDILAGNSFEKKIFDKIIKYTDKFIAIDKLTYNALNDYGLKNVFNLPNPLSSKIQKLITSIPEAKRVHKSVLYAGHIVPAKGVFELAKACSLIGDVSLVLFGQYDEKTKVELLKQIPVSYHNLIKFRGNCSIEEVLEAMKKCSVFVLPSYSEGFPNVIIESMACGCPIIATPVGAIPQMLDIDGTPCGTIVPSKDVDALKDAILKVLTSRGSDAMGIRAKNRVNELYSIDAIWPILKDIWVS